MDKVLNKILENALKRIDVVDLRNKILEEINHEYDKYVEIQKLKNEKLEIANKSLQEQAKIDKKILLTCDHSYVTAHTDIDGTEYQCDFCGELIDED